MPPIRTLAQRTATARRTLQALGRRRRQLKRDEEKWREDAAKALRGADGLIQKTEAAEILGIDRTTVYEILG